MSWKEWRNEALGDPQVLDILLNGERIEDYPSDTPYPNALFLGWAHQRPLHVVVAYSVARRTAYIITAYEPDLTHFEGDFKTRKRANHEPPSS